MRLVVVIAQLSAFRISRTILRSLLIGIVLGFSSFAVGCGDSTAQIRVPLSLDERGLSVRQIQLDDLLKLRDLESLSLSPNSKYASFMVREASYADNNYQSQWYTMPVDGKGAPVPTIDAGDPIFQLSPYGPVGDFEATGVQWSPDSKNIAYLVKRDDETSVWVSDVSGADVRLVSRPGENVVDVYWTPDGASILYGVGESVDTINQRELGAARRGYLYNDLYHPPSGQELIDREATPIVLEVRQVDRFGKGNRSLNESGGDMYNALRSPTVDPAIQSLDKLKSAPNTPGVAWLADLPTQNARGLIRPKTLFATLSDDVDDARPCMDPECTGYIEDLWWSIDGRKIFYLVRKGVVSGGRSLYQWEIPSGVVKPLMTTNDHLSSCQSADQNIVCFHAAPKQPRRIVKVSLQSAEIMELFDPNPQFQRLLLGSVKRLEWADSFGNRVFGHLVLPPSHTESDKHPLIVTQYRYSGFLRGGVGDEYPIFALAANGFAVLDVDRPEPMSILMVESDPIEAEAAVWKDLLERRSTLSTVLNGIDLVESLGVIDPSKVGITGLSDGSETVWYSLINSNRIAAAISSHTGFNPYAYYMTSGTVREWLRRWGIGAKGGLQDLYWDRITPALNVNKINTPILINAADRELLSGIENVVALKEASKPIELFIYPDEYHIKWQPAHRAMIYERNIDWMNFWLRDLEDRDPEKATQYERWRKLREHHEAHSITP